MVNTIFVDVLKECENVHVLQGVSEDQVNDAEFELGVQFAPEYRQYLMEFGVASIKAHEFTGLGSSKRLSVVENTLQERKLHPGQLDHLYVVEQANIDGIIFLQAADGKVYSVGLDDDIRLICDSLADYIKTPGF